MASMWDLFMEWVEDEWTIREALERYGDGPALHERFLTWIEDCKGCEWLACDCCEQVLSQDDLAALNVDDEPLCLKCKGL